MGSQDPELRVGIIDPGNGEGSTEPHPTAATVRWRSVNRPRRVAVLTVVVAVATLVILLSSAIVPSPGAWHFGPPAGLTPDTSAGSSATSSFYPYLANTTVYPAPDSLSEAAVNSPVVLESGSGCQGPTALSTGTENGGSVVVAGSLAPNGCQLYSISIAQSAIGWYNGGGIWLNAIESDVTVVGSVPAFSLYGGMNSVPGPSDYAAKAQDSAYGRAVVALQVTQSGNEWGGWGTYEFAVVASGASYGSYCFDVVYNTAEDNFTVGCHNWVLDAQASASSGGSGLSVDFTGTVSGHCNPYTFSWKFGDGGTSTSQNTSYTYSTGGTFPVSLTARDGCGDTAWSDLTVYVWSGAGSPRSDLPRLVSTVVGTTPEFLLLEATSGPASDSYLLIRTGVYNSSDAKAIYNGTASYHLPISWSSPQIVAEFSQPITGDALVASPDGRTLVAAAASGGSTWVFQSPNGGVGWPGLTPSPVPGSSPELALGDPGVVLTTIASGSVYVTTLSSHGYGAPQVELAPGSTAVPVWASGVASGVTGVGVASGGVVYYYRSTDNGFLFGPSGGTEVGRYQSTSGSPIFESVGQTRLSDPQASAGTLTVTAEGPNVFLLYTSEVNGRTVANVTTSPDGGVSWNPTMTYQLQAGSIAQPQAISSPTGYVYVTWTDDAHGSPAVDQAVFLADGRMIQSASPLPGTGGSPGFAATEPTVAVDPFMRSLYAWVSDVGSSSPSLQVTGAFLKPLDATNLTNAAFQQLTAWDFNPSSSTQLTTQATTTASFNSNVTKLTAALLDPSPNPCYPSAAQNATALLYHGDTAFPLAYDLTPSSACANLQPAVAPASNISTEGVFAPSTYLSVLDDWIFEGEGVQVDYRGDALAAALGSGINPDPSATGLPPVPGPATTYSHSSTVLGQSATASVTLWPLNPTTGAIDSTVSFPLLTVINSHTVYCGVDSQGHPLYATWYNESETVSYSWSVAVEGQSHSFSSSVYPEGSWDLPYEVYLTNLTPNAAIAWSTGSFQATYDRFYKYYDACTGASWTKDTGQWATGAIGGFSGTLYTNLSMVPSGPGSTFIQATPDGPAHQNLTYLWNNTMPARASISLSWNGGSGYWSSNQWSIPESPTYVGASNGVSYSTSITAQSQPGAWNSTQEPSISAGEDTYAYPLSASFGCSFPLQVNPVRIDGHPWVIPDPSSNKATVVWNSTANGPSWIQFYELGVGLNWSQTAIANTTGPSGYPYQYSVELQGIPSFALFGVTAWTSYVAVPGCISYANSSSNVFLTPGAFGLYEWDHPYDTITQQGGGASVSWNVAPGFVTNGVLLNGALFYRNDTTTPTTVVAPIDSSAGLTQSATTYVYNLSLAQLNTRYTAWVELNYSVHWQSMNADFTIVSTPCTFVYQQDTSGDGLTDLEKALGWTVTYSDLYGGTTDLWVTANPSLYATNGLVNDFLEKEFGLNPNTLDTAGSHMLDTWNLTFPLSSSSCPAGFECWYENGSNPFSSKVTPTGPNPGGKPVATNSTSAAHWTSGGLQDDAPYDAEVLWTGGALGVLESLITSDHVGWLRGVIMHGYNKEWTLTVWGKLSWGANPLAQSTTGDGLVDGAQPNPVSREALQVTITSWTANLKSGNDEAAPFLEVSGTGAYGNTVFSGGYGPAKKGSSVSFSGAYVISAPIVSSSQFASFNITLVDNASTSGTNLYYPLQFGPVSVDLLGSSGTHSLSRTQSNASLKVTYEVLWVGEAANTLLWAPANNTTLSNLPWGLKRYTAEPDFDLIVLNLTSAITLTGIAGAEGGWSYSVHLDAGLNNLLVPRGAFLASPLGQALINNTNLSVPIPAGAGVTFHPTDWSSRTETSGSNAPGGPNYIWVFSTLSQSQNGSSSNAFGGLPQNPAVESGYQSRQVGAVFWVNVTGAGYGGLTSAAAELKDLFGGLVLNASGNRTGNLLTVTTELGTLGLPANVRAAMANVTLQNDGAYGAPEYQQPPPSPSFWQAVGDAVWNTLSGIASDVTALVSVVWNAVQAAAAYVGEAASWLSSHLGLSKLASQLVSGLKTLASAMEWALYQIVDYLYALVKALLSPIVGAVQSVIQPYDASLAAPLKQAWASENTTGSVTTVETDSIGAAFGGPAFAVSLGIGVAVTIALTLLTPLDLGPSFVIGIVIGLIAGALLSRGFVTSLASTLSSSAVFSIENLANRTVTLPVTEWATLAGVLGLVAAGAEVPYSWYVLSQALNIKNAPADELFGDAAAITAIALTAIFIGALAIPSGDSILLVLAFVLATLALAGVSIHYFTNEFIQTNPGLKQLAFVDVGLSAGAMAGSLADLGGSISKL